MAGTSGTPEGSPAGPDDINSRLAEIAAELAAEARFKEPSAAERARMRVTAVRPAAKARRRGPLHRLRARRRADELRQPVRGAGMPAPEPRQPPKKARRAAARPVPDRGYADASEPSRLRTGTALVIIVALLIGASIGLRYYFRHRTLAAAGAHLTPAQTHSPRASITSSPPTPTIAVSTPPPDPFANSPAEHFADNAAGLVPPPPHRTGQFTVAEVKAAYAKTVQLLVVGHLNPETLAGTAQPLVFADLLAKSQRTSFLRNLGLKGLTKQGHLRSTRYYVTSFAPASTLLVGSVIKVHGGMMAETARDGSRTVLRVHADYLFVYPVKPTADTDQLLLLVARVDMNADFAAWNPGSNQLVPLISSIRGDVAGSRCGPYDGFVRPAFAGPGATPRPTGPFIRPYDLNTPPPAAAECVRVSGT